MWLSERPRARTNPMLWFSDAAEPLPITTARRTNVWTPDSKMSGVPLRPVGLGGSGSWIGLIGFNWRIYRAWVLVKKVKEKNWFLKWQGRNWNGTLQVFAYKKLPGKEETERPRPMGLKPILFLFSFYTQQNKSNKKLKIFFH